METDKALIRTFVHVYYKDGYGATDEIQMYINLSPSEAANYYLGKSYPFVGYVENGEYFESMLTAWRVDCDQVQEYHKGKGWQTITEDVRKSYRLQGGQIVETIIYYAMKLSKNNLRLIGSAGSLQDLRQMIEQKMFWNVVSIDSSTQFECGRKQCYDITTGKGLNHDVVIIKEGQRYKLYMVA